LSPDGIGISDEDSNIVFANTALARLVGATDPTQIIGKKTLDFTHPDYLDTVQGRIQQLRSGQRVPMVAGKWIKLDGTSIDVETAGVPIRRRGKLFYQGFVRDITDRKKAEATLEESRRRLQAVFNTAIDTITLFDSEGHFVDANPAATALLGYSREELLQSNIGVLSSQEDPAKTTRALRNVLTAGRESGEAVIRRKDGSTREIEYRAVGNVLPGLHFVMMHDITARKEAERSLQQLSARLLRLQDEERRRIARQLHDTTGQSLAALRLNLSRIGRSAATADPAAKDAVDESIALTEQSISEIRTLSYLLHPPLIDEAGLLPSLRWYVRGFQERSGIKVTFEAPEEIDRLRPDFETAVFRIMQEALTNIQRHSGSAVARVRLEREPQSVRLQIEDEGRGMPGHLRGREEAMAAAGVGIAGIRERVRELGGRVEIQSEDRGTRIVVTLPLSGP
jgi:PAS domain S-box-containing protein